MENIKIAVIGLGYVGLPLSCLLATKYPVIGFDINAIRVAEVNKGYDRTFEVPDDVITSVLTASIPENSLGLHCTNKPMDLKDCNLYIVTVPTPVDKNNRPDLTNLLEASELIGNVIARGDIVVYESTVYPGATEQDCIPVIEQISGLVFNQDFWAGYSPERINPGDKEHTIDKVKKITSGSTPEAAQRIDAVYRSVIPAGTHPAPSIRVAEAAKVIENTQRDINIAFVNELKKIFDRMEIDTTAVLEAAATKWNFLPFKPGLVGGHCIGVDPFYLSQKAQQYGYHPEIILAGRRINDSMGEYVASQVVKLMIKKGISPNGANILILGITFKENCSDVRNTKVVDVINALKEYNANMVIYDPWANPAEVEREYGLKIAKSMPQEPFDAVVLAVAHKEFARYDVTDTILYDLRKPCF